MIAIAAKILTIASITFTGMYFVAGMAMENVVLKYEKRQHERLDSVSVASEKRNSILLQSLENTLKRSQNAFSLDEYGEIVKEKVDDGVKSMKRYTDKQNKSQEQEAEKMFKEVYFMDDKDSTFKLLTYKVNGKYMVVRQIPISTSEFNAINN